MKLIVGQAPPPVPITEPPSVPCELTPELADLLGIPYLPDLMRAYLKEQREGTAPNLLFTIPEAQTRAPGPHVSHLGHADDGGLCKRQLWMRYQSEGQHPGEMDYGREMGLNRGHATEAWIVAILTDQMARLGWRAERNLACDYVHKSGQLMTGELDVLFSRDKADPWFILDSKETEDDRLGRMSAPSPSNVSQQQGYLGNTVYDAEFAILAYVGRWLEVRFFFVPKDDEETERRANEVLAVYQSPDAPEVLEPKVERGSPLKDESRSIKVSLPWQCDYCPFLGHGCDGALEKSFRGHGMWGHERKDNTFKTKAGMEPVVDAFGHDRLAELLLT